MRSRNIKPGFFENEKLAELDPLARILFSGLWCYADREGRFEWRPKRIKALILPYDDCDIDELLMSLHVMTFIYMYRQGNDTYGFIPKFKEHQNPHPHEAKSKLPPPPDNIEENQCHDIAVTLNEKSEECNADILIPDILIPDILIPEKLPSDDKPLPCPHQEIIALYNHNLPTLTKVIPKLWNGTREKQLQSRWREDPERQNLRWWANLFARISQSSFLIGNNEKGWKADLGWITKQSSMIKILEGKYDDKKDVGFVKRQPMSTKERDARRLMGIQDEA